MTKVYNNILIIKPSAMGDIVMALPALSALKKAFPSARISWLVRQEFAPLLKGHPYIDELVLFDRKLLAKWYCNPSSFQAFRAFIEKLKSGRYDLAIDLQGLFRSAAFGFLSGAKERLGMAEAREFAWLFYNHKVRQDRRCIHLVDFYLKMVQEVTGQNSGVEFVFPVNMQARESVARLLAKNSLEKGNFAVLVPGSARVNKCWPTRRFAKLADHITEKYGMPVAAIGTKGESQLTAGIKDAAKNRVVDLAGQTNIPELCELMKSARLVVSNDTGPGHIAAAMGVPTVLIFGPTNPARVSPYGRLDRVVAFDAQNRGFKADSYDPRHEIERITLDMVVQKVDNVMSTAEYRQL